MSSRAQTPLEQDVQGLFESHPPEVLAALDTYRRWRRLTHPASCQCHDCRMLRGILLRAGLWEEVQ